MYEYIPMDKKLTFLFSTQYLISGYYKKTQNEWFYNMRI